MRRRLVLAAVAVTTTIVLAFCIPLARLVRDVARDEAIGVAERDAERVTGALAATTDPDVVTAVMASTEAGSEDRVGLVLPDGSTLGAVGLGGDEIGLARETTEAFTVDAGAAILLVVPVELADGIAVIHVRIPASATEQGVAEAWAILAGVAMFLLAVGVVLADRLASSVTRPAVALADASRRVADGDLSVRVSPAGPPELQHAATGFNDLAGRLSDLVAEERRGVADVAHRLRTPLAAMHLDVESVADPVERDRLVGDVTELEHAVDTVIREARRPIGRALTPVSDLADVTRGRVAFWSALAEEQRRPWTARIAATSLTVGVPRAELAAVVDALLDNVFTHTPAGTGFEVVVEPAASDRARLLVRDGGPGFGARPSEASSGADLGHTGLGLDIVTRTAHAGGGTVEMVDDDGATVVLELPLVADGAPVPPAGRRRHPIAHAGPD